LKSAIFAEFKIETSDRIMAEAGPVAGLSSLNCRRQTKVNQ